VSVTALAREFTRRVRLADSSAWATRSRGRQGSLAGDDACVLVMLAGPVSMLLGVPADEVAANLTILRRAAVEVWRRGHVPVVGVHEGYPLIPYLRAGEDAAQMVNDVPFGLAERCGAIILFGGSEAAEEEARRVAARGGRIFRAVDELPPAEPDLSPSAGPA
jgi:hypothetical protein